MGSGSPDKLWSADSRTRCLPFWKRGKKYCLFSLSILYFKFAVASRLIYRWNTAKNGSNFAFMWLVVYFPDTLIYLAETAVILVVSHRKAVTVTSSAVTVTFRSTKRKFLPSLWVFSSVKGFVTITVSAGSVTFMSGGTNILLSLPSLFYRRVFRNFERTSEQDKTFPMVKGIAEKRRIELSPSKANNHRTSKLAWLKASQTLFACSVDF